MTFEEALFYENDSAQANTDKLNKAIAKQDKAQAKANQANADADKASKLANFFTEKWGLKQGEALEPKQIIEKIKADTSILDEIAKNEELRTALGYKTPEDITNLKNAASLGGGENAEDGNAEDANTVQCDVSQLNCKTAQSSNDKNYAAAWNEITEKLRTILGGQQQGGDSAAANNGGTK